MEPINNNRAKVLPLVLCAILGGGIATGGNIAYQNHMAASNSLTKSTTTSVGLSGSEKNSDKVSAVAAKALSSVVTVGVVGDSQSGSGSGVVIDDQGHIITNNHVVTVDGQVLNPNIQVKDSNGDVYSAKVVGKDPTSDLAVIKIDNAKLPAIEFADSDKLAVGQTAVAIGAPLGLSESVTDGIISSLNRTITVQSSDPEESSSKQDQQSDKDQENEQSQQEPFKFQLPDGSTSQDSGSTVALNVIQTDAAINPGNSGGALLDEDGKLIGINVAIASATGSETQTNGNIGVSFAIPSENVQRVANDIIKNGKATHGYLGVSITSHPAGGNEKTASFSDGAQLQEVTKGSPMEQAGFKKGDIITKFGDKEIAESGDLSAIVRATAPGSKVEVEFKRDGKEQKTTVTVGENK
ncbi:MAG: trypsin-like peptidase domain-containing protein [Micrococcaceae bacterium]